MNKKQFLNVGFEIKNIQEDETEDGKLFVFEGYASTFGNVDHGGDVILKGAFAESLKNRMPALLWQHNHSEPIGIFKEVREDEIGLYVKGCLPMDDDLVKGRIVPQIKIGSVSTMSIGYIVESSEDIEYREDGVRALKKVTLLENSLVTIPMNDMAKVSGFKSLLSQLDSLTGEERKELVEKLDDVKYTFDDVEEITTKKEFERFLRKAGLSRKAAAFMMSRVKMQSDQCNTDDSEESASSELLEAVSGLKSLLLESQKCLKN